MTRRAGRRDLLVSRLQEKVPSAAKRGEKGEKRGDNRRLMGRKKRVSSLFLSEQERGKKKGKGRGDADTVHHLLRRRGKLRRARSRSIHSATTTKERSHPPFSLRPTSGGERENRAVLLATRARKGESRSALLRLYYPSIGKKEKRKGGSAVFDGRAGNDVVLLREREMGKKKKEKSSRLTWNHLYFGARSLATSLSPFPRTKRGGSAEPLILFETSESRPQYLSPFTDNNKVEGRIARLP